MKCVVIVCVAFAALAVCSAKVDLLPKSFVQKLKHHEEKKPAIKPESRIIEGKPVEGVSAPYIVSISVSSVAYAHNCAGSIIGKEWVLTAGHCVREIEAMSPTESIIGLPLYAGITDRDDLEHAQKRIINFAFVHKAFNGEIGSDDIALIHVSEPFQFDVNVRSIALPALNEDFTGQESTLYGWGLTDNTDNIYVKNLRVDRSNVLNPEQCQAKLPEDAPVSQSMICVSVPACYGDGGSPLTIERNGLGMELVGVTSWGYIPCGYDKRPTAYTAVAKYIEWIIQVQQAYHILH